MTKLYLYPLWLRIWHFINAITMILLFISGISLHYSETASLFFPFEMTILVHNISGVILSINYIFFFIFNFLTGNFKFYIPNITRNYIKQLLIQARYYIIDIFDHEPHPFPPNKDRKFNPLQKLGYLSIMYIFVPMVVITGFMLMFPNYAPDEILGMGGVWPAAILHITAGFFVSIFTFVHLYLGTTGHTVGDLYKGIVTGYHDAEEGYEDSDDVKVAKLGKRVSRSTILPPVLYNPISTIGGLISLVSFSIILFLTVIDLFAETDNTYLGIFTYMILPAFLIFGIFLIIFGAFRENRLLLSNSKKERKLPILDLNNTKHQVATIAFLLIFVILIVFSGYGSYKAYEYSESDEFCGTVCHTVMEPEYVTYTNSPHSNVGCVKCHIGSGADWFVKSKFSGAYQLYAVAADVYPVPIKTPVENLRPASETCEECHSPKHFYDQKIVKRDYYLYNENNTHFSLEMQLKVGGGNIEIGNIEGIHWHMNLGNEITFLATDREKQEVPWVKTKSLVTGKETVYQVPGFDIEKALEEGKKMKGMDCIDCHNRPSHIFNPPDQIVNLFMSLGKIDVTIPYIKNISVSALENATETKENVLAEIDKYVWDFYNSRIKNINKDLKTKIDNAIVELSRIYAKNYFPLMDANWTNHSNNIGHMYSKGCYRCHDGKHVNTEGKVLTMECSTCHDFKTEMIVTDSVEVIKIIDDFVHPGGDDKNIKEQNCVVCHGAPKYRKSVIEQQKVLSIK